MSRTIMCFVMPFVLILSCAAAGHAARSGRDYTLHTREELARRAEDIRAQYAAPELFDRGILDVTKAPYNADPTGRRDCTDAIQRAVRDARDSRAITYFPAGTYKVSDSIVGKQACVNPGGGGVRWRPDDYHCVLWGAAGEERATIKLADNAPGFGNPKQPETVLFLTASNWRQPGNLQPNVSFNQMIIGLNVDLGEGNPGAIGIDHQAAQGSLAMDVHVDASGGFAGFRGCPGSGGGVFGISVTGGRYGLYLGPGWELDMQSGAQPSPVISDVTLRGQSENSIYYTGRGPLTVVGADIEGTGIRLKGGGWAPWNGALNLIDSVVRLSDGKIAVSGNRPAYLRNVYLKNAETVARLRGSPALRGVQEGWMHLTEYAGGTGKKYPLWIDGTRRLKPLVEIERDSGRPPADLGKRHRVESAPSWQIGGAVNVTEAPYGARGDGKADDAPAIQKALDEADTVFLPKGVYKISRPLELDSRDCLVGLGVHSIIHPLEGAPAFSDPENPRPLVRTSDDADAITTLAFLRLWSRVPGCYALHWRAGGNSTVMGIDSKRWPWGGGGDANHPLIRVTGSGGGRWYCAHFGSPRHQGPDYRHFVARGTRQPLDFYMFNPEHAGSVYQTEFDDVRDVDIYGMKGETVGATGQVGRPLIFFKESRDFRVFGYGGNATGAAGSCLFLLENCSDFLLANFALQHARVGEPPEKWSTVTEVTSDGRTIHAPGTEWFTLYRRD